MSGPVGAAQATDCNSSASWWTTLFLMWLASLLVFQVPIVAASGEIPPPQYLQAATAKDVSPTTEAGWIRLAERSRRIFNYVVRKPSTGSLLFLFMAALLFVYIYGSGKVPIDLEALESHLNDLYEKAALGDGESWIEKKGSSIAPSSYLNTPETNPADISSHAHPKINPLPPIVQPPSPEQHHPPRLLQEINRKESHSTTDEGSKPALEKVTPNPNPFTSPAITEQREELGVIPALQRTKSPLPNKLPSRSPSRRRNRHKRHGSNTTNADAVNQQKHNPAATSPSHSAPEKKRNGGRNQRQTVSEPASPAVPVNKDHHHHIEQKRDLHKSSSLSNLAALHSQTSHPSVSPHRSPPTAAARTASKISHSRSYSTPYTLTAFAKAAETRTSPPQQGAPAWSPSPRAWVGATPLRSNTVNRGGAPPGLDNRPIRSSSLSTNTAPSPTSLFASPPTSPSMGYAIAPNHFSQSTGFARQQQQQQQADLKWYSPFVSGLSIPLDDEEHDVDFDLPAPALPSASEFLHGEDGDLSPPQRARYAEAAAAASHHHNGMGMGTGTWAMGSGHSALGLVNGIWGRSVGNRAGPIGSSRPGFVYREQRSSFEEERRDGNGRGQFSLFDGRSPFAVERSRA